MNGRDGEAGPQRNFARDVVSAVLFVGASAGLTNLFAFIARSRLGAAEQWVGIIGAAGYIGYLWNLFLARVTARLSVRRGMLVMMAACGALLWIGAFQHRVWPYCLAVIAFVSILGLWEVQYNTLVGALYDVGTRPRILSRRYLSVSIATALLAVVFGRLSNGEDGHLWAFLIAGAMTLAGAAVFRNIRTTQEHHMAPFHPLDVARTVWHDRRFRRLAAILTFYGWVGAGVGTLLALFYSAIGFEEGEVGLLSAVRIAGALAGLLVVTPRLRFAGGISNFRLCFVSSAAAMAIFLIAGSADLGRWRFGVLACGEFAFGISAAGFQLAIQTTGLSLAGPGQSTLYVNALMIVQGLRGMIAPILVAMTLRYAGLQPTLIASVAVAMVCATLVLLPGIDGEAAPRA
ncbi:MAG: MFS transporter [Planctomycetota bacterium]